MSCPDDFDDYADTVAEWHDREWPSPDGSPADISRVCMKLTEEVGELQGALVKHLQGRTDKDWLTEAEAEFGDTLIVLCTLSARMRQLRAADERYLWPTFVRMFQWRWFGRSAEDGGVSSRRGATYRTDVPA